VPVSKSSVCFLSRFRVVIESNPLHGLNGLRSASAGSCAGESAFADLSLGSGARPFDQVLLKGGIEHYLLKVHFNL
jgi:hypothetical protein